MEFASDAHRACYARVTDFMVQLYGESAQPNEEHPYFVLQEGSAVQFTEVLPWGDDYASVVSYSYVVTDVEPTLELCQFLLAENAKFRLGGFTIENERTVVFQHGLGADGLEKAQLAASVTAVRTTADEHDDLIVARFGGLTARDRTSVPPPPLADAADPPAPPETPPAS